MREQGVKDAVEDVEGLVGLAVGQDDRLDLVAAERADHRLEVERRDRLVAHDHDLPADDVAPVQLGVADEARADVDRVGAVAEVDVKGPHG